MKLINHLAAAVLVTSSALTAATLTLVPSAATVAPGDAFTLDVNISDAVDVYAYQFDIGFNPTLLSASSVTGGSFLGAGGTTLFIEGFIDNAAGTISSIAESLQTFTPGVSGGGTLVQLTFVSVGGGSAVITPFGVTVLDSSLASINTTAQSVTVQISAVPEPSTAACISMACLWAITIGARRGRR